MSKKRPERSGPRKAGRPSPGFWRLAARVLPWVLATNAAFVVYLVWAHMNLLQVDAAGHVASAHALRDGYFHRFYDAVFWGYVQNLFYPPLEDALIALASLLTGGDMFTAYRLYLSLAVAAYAAAVVHFARSFGSAPARAVFLIAMLVVMNAEKGGPLSFQGLSFADLLDTGLSAELLGAVFFFLLLREIIRPEPSLAAALYLALALLSHLVVGPAALLVTGLAFLFRRTARLFEILAFAGGLTAFALLPIFAYKGYTRASTIIKEPNVFMVVLLVAIFLLLARRRDLLAIPAASLILALPETFGPLLEKMVEAGVAPVYHYYRLKVVAVLLLMVSLALLLDVIRERRDRQIAFAMVLLTAIFATRNLPPADYRKHLAQPAPDPRITFESLPTDRLTRTFTIHHKRPVDFYLDSVLQVEQPGALFNKGLYWESSRNHPLLSSYLATLLSPETIVLDNLYFRDLGCDLMQCLADHFFGDTGVGTVLAADADHLPYLEPDRKACWREIFRDGTPGYAFRFEEEQLLEGVPYRLYRLVDRDPRLSSAFVERVKARDLRPVDPDEEWYFGELLEESSAACLDGRINRQTFVWQDDLERLREHLETSDLAEGGPEIEIERAGEGYRIHVPGNRPGLFKIKLSYFPGVELRDAAGNEVPLYDALGGMVAIGSGTLELHYRRTQLMYLGYALSVLTLGLYGWRARMTAR